MATATKLFENLAESLGKSTTSIEAYGLALRRKGWWEQTKRGRAAKSMTDMDAGKLLLAILSSGPSELQGYFIKYANLRLDPASYEQPMTRILLTELELTKKSMLLDFIEAFVRLYRTNKTDDLIYFKTSPDGYLDDFLYDGPSIELAIQGPFPLGTIKFLPSKSLREKMKKEGICEDKLFKHHTLVFLDQLYGWKADSIEKGATKESKEGYGNAIQSLRKETSRGVHFERSIGGREFTAIGKALRGK